MNSTIHLSVVIPAFNEADNFYRGALTEAVNYLASQHYSWELILVNDGSGDNTLQLLHDFASGKPQVKVIDNSHQGKAATVITGALAARGKYILFSDMDQATPISEAAKIMQKLESGYDIVIGSRLDRKGAPLHRKILAYGMVVMRSIILRLPYKDTQCGFKAFTKAAAEKIFSIMNSVHPPKSIVGSAVNPGFDVELLYLGRKLGFRIDEVSVVWKHQKTARVGFVKDAIAGLTELLLVRWRSLTNVYRL
jgi:dolichyl-phosphate beta-glucosyltransferase